jgi:hypothetical protein
MAKAKKTTKKQPKPRADKYEDKLKINGSFDDLAKALINPKNPLKKDK